MQTFIAFSLSVVEGCADSKAYCIALISNSMFVGPIGVDWIEAKFVYAEDSRRPLSLSSVVNFECSDVEAVVELISIGSA